MEGNMELKGSRTEKNLITAFAGESQARNRYTYFSGVARKEGFIQIADIFEETSNHEKEHAKRFFKFLPGGECSVSGTFPSGIIGTTVQNLKGAADDEKLEWETLYPDFSLIARKEGFMDIASTFDFIAVAEKQHEKRYRGLLSNLEQGTVFKKEKAIIWKCRNCGYINAGTEAPITCPACLHPKDYYEILAENW
jgi:rubrerythrin